LGRCAKIETSFLGICTDRSAGATDVSVHLRLGAAET
jgi:hypothetical protein